MVAPAGLRSLCAGGEVQTNRRPRGTQPVIQEDGQPVPAPTPLRPPAVPASRPPAPTPASPAPASRSPAAAVTVPGAAASATGIPEMRAWLILNVFYYK